MNGRLQRLHRKLVKTKANRKIGNVRFERETVHCIDRKNDAQELHLHDEEQLSQ